MPYFEYLPYPSRYNSLRLHGFDYNSPSQLCALTLVTDSRRPVFADLEMAKTTLNVLLSDENLSTMQLRAFTLMPDHLHLIAGVWKPELNLPTLIGRFKSLTTQLYWRRSREVLAAGVSLPSQLVSKSETKSRTLITALIDGRATLRPEIVALKKWPLVQPQDFRSKRLWQTKFFDHVIRNEIDFQANLDYILLNPVRAGYVSHPCFYPYTGLFI